jgi:hypothetical protein
MKLTGPQIISQLRDKLTFDVGRHLYAVLGGYEQLAQFERHDLAEARDADRGSLSPPLQRQPGTVGPDWRRRPAPSGQSGGASLQRRPASSEPRLRPVAPGIVATKPAGHSQAVRTAFRLQPRPQRFAHRASNQSHILLLLPGERRGERLAIFHEAAERFQRTVPQNLVADNHLWELTGELDGTFVIRNL